MSEFKKENTSWRTVALIGGSIAAVGAAYLLYTRFNNPPSAKKDQICCEISNNLDSSPASRANDYRELGNKNYRANRFDRAVEFYTLAIEVCPVELEEEFAVFHQNRSAAYFSMEKYEESLEDCNIALKIKPRYVKALSRRGRIFEILERYQEALDDATAVCLINAFSSDENIRRADRAMKKLASVQLDAIMINRESNISLPDKSFIEDLFRTFENDPLQKEYATETNGFASRDGDNLNSTKLFEAFHALKEKEYHKCFQLALEAVQQVETSLSRLTEEHCRNKCLAYLLRGTFYYISFNAPRALADLEKVVELCSNYPADDFLQNMVVNAHIRRVACYQETDPVTNFEKCIQIFDLAEKVSTTNSDLFFFRAQFHMQLASQNNNLSNIYDIVIEDLAKANKLSLGNPLKMSFIFYVKIFMALQRMDMSSVESELSKWNALIETYSSNSDILVLQATVFHEMGDFDRAIERFKQAVEISNSKPNCLVKLAIALMHKSAMTPSNLSLVPQVVDPESLKLLKRAVRIEPLSFIANESLGQFLNQIGELENCLLYYEKACQLPNWPKAIESCLALKESVASQLRIVRKLNISQEEMFQFRHAAFGRMCSESVSSAPGPSSLQNANDFSMFGGSARD